MHPLRASVTSRGELLLCVRAGERHVVGWFAPIEMARLRIVGVLDIESTRVTNIPVVVNFVWVGGVRRRR